MKKESFRKKNLQCNNQAPGLSATTRRVIDSPEGIWNTSLRIGFACPSTTGGSESGSEKFDDRATIMGLCPCKWLSKGKKIIVIKTERGKKRLTKDVCQHPRFG
jgi:hypothetical protein